MDETNTLPRHIQQGTILVQLDMQITGAEPGLGFGDLSLVNNFHLTQIIFSVVSK